MSWPWRCALRALVVPLEVPAPCGAGCAAWSSGVQGRRANCRTTEPRTADASHQVADGELPILAEPSRQHEPQDPETTTKPPITCGSASAHDRQYHDHRSGVERHLMCEEGGHERENMIASASCYSRSAPRLNSTRAARRRASRARRVLRRCAARRTRLRAARRGRARGSRARLRGRLALVRRIVLGELRQRDALELGIARCELGLARRAAELGRRAPS